MILYRLPYSEEVHRIASDDVIRIPDVESLKGRRGFIMMPYRFGDGEDIVLFPKSDCDDIVSLDNVIASFCAGEACRQEVRMTMQQADEQRRYDEYKHIFSLFSNALSENRFEKLVLSRKAQYACSVTEKQLVDIFVRACRKYPRMMIYLALLPSGGAWIGCTPEILIAGEKSHYRTMALAGTMSVTEDVTVKDVSWSKKNRREQEIVADYVRGCVSPFAAVLEEEGPYTSRAGHLVHLKTEFHFTPKCGVDILDVVKTLHPTPAVCGIPAKDANDFIQANEGYNRSYYSGVVGVIDPVGETNLYVNLRCAHFKNGEVNFYAGGGILKDSELDDEWNETKVKMLTVMSLIG